MSRDDDGGSVRAAEGDAYGTTTRADYVGAPVSVQIDEDVRSVSRDALGCFCITLLPDIPPAVAHFLKLRAESVVLALCRSLFACSKQTLPAVAAD